jgi:tripartite-type tricarboxylate transporter receptor subunit TctC
MIVTRRRAVAEGRARASASPADFPSFVAAETERWTRVIREAGISAP